MKPLRKRLEEVSKSKNLRLDIIQQDYLLSSLLAGIFEHPILSSALIFKGGTALKKCYFGHYRFSEDLDFSVVSTGTDISFLTPIAEACKNIQAKISEYALIQITVKKYEEKSPHPHGQEAFTVSAQFPWQSQPLTKAMIEISKDEKILLQPAKKVLLHDYGETFTPEIQVYSLEEIILEKLRAILQHTKKIYERDWSRSRARDYYDLWRIFETFERHIDLEIIHEFLPLKCSSKNVFYNTAEDFFDEKMILHVRNTWTQWLSPLVSDLPNVELILQVLRSKITTIISPQFASH